MLENEVPARLALIRETLTVDPENPVTWPPDPRSYVLADELPLKEEQYPAVLITSTTSGVDTPVQAGLGEFIYEYTLNVSCAVVSTRHGGQTQASIGRDRILLAIRESLLLNSQLANDCFAVVRSANEQTGAAIENLQSKPMSLGSITFAVRVIEELQDLITTDAGQPAVISTHSETVTAVDAAHNLQ